jgi:epoxyqueuosine reductase
VRCCQEVCPWNASPVNLANPSWSSRQDLNVASLIDLWRRTDEELTAFIGDTAMTRAGVRGLRRNLAVALGNSGDRRALDVFLEIPAGGDTRADPLVLEHVAWATSKLCAAS